MERMGVDNLECRHEELKIIRSSAARNDHRCGGEGQDLAVREGGIGRSARVVFLALRPEIEVRSGMPDHKVGAHSPLEPRHPEPEV